MTTPGDSNTSVRTQAFLRGLIAPHPSIVVPSERNRAQLLAILSLGLTPFMFIGGISSGSYGTFLTLTIVTLLSYFISRTAYYNTGAYLFTYSLTSIAFLLIYQGSANSIDSAVSSIVHIALVLASALLSRRGFVLLVALSVVAIFMTPFYSNVVPNEIDSFPRTAGIVMVLGLILYGVNVFLANLDRNRLEDLQNANVELEDVRANLERRVSERTNELQAVNQQIEHRALRLQAIAEISQSIATNTNMGLPELLSYTARSISEKTGYYHVGIFLLDEKREYAVLRAANSAGGRRMLERRHQLKVGGTGIVGYVSQGGRSRIALDTGTDAVFFNNPDLPETRSEMALPLKAGTQVIGVLDVQSTSPSAFNDEDVTALSTLANQIAIIIQNSQLRQGGFEAQRTVGRLGPQIGQKSDILGFSYLTDGTIAAATGIEATLIQRAVDAGEIVVLDQFTHAKTPMLVVPVKLRDQVIGIVHVESADPKRKWTEDEIAMVQAVSDRAALALENASLFEATERRATQERVVAEVTSRIGESNDMERILQTTIQELGRTLGAARTFIQLSTPSNGNGSHHDDDREEQA